MRNLSRTDAQICALSSIARVGAIGLGPRRAPRPSPTEGSSANHPGGSEQPACQRLAVYLVSGLNSLFKNELG